MAAYDYQYNHKYGIYFGAATGYNKLPINIEGVTPIAAPYIKHGLFKITLFGEVLALSINIPIN